jgi:hypothetical protein
MGSLKKGNGKEERRRKKKEGQDTDLDSNILMNLTVFPFVSPSPPLLICLFAHLFALNFFSIATFDPTFAIAILNPNSLPLFIRRLFQNHDFFLVTNTTNAVRVSATSIPKN